MLKVTDAILTHINEETMPLYDTGEIRTAYNFPSASCEQLMLIERSTHGNAVHMIAAQLQICQFDLKQVLWNAGMHTVSATADHKRKIKHGFERLMCYQFIMHTP